MSWTEREVEEEQTFRVKIRGSTPGVICKEEVRVSRNNFIKNFRDKMR